MSNRVNVAERQTALDELRKLLPPGSTVYTILEHVSRSGMTRYIRILIPQIDEHGRVFFLHPNHLVSVAIRTPRAPRGYEGLKMEGCGMDMGFALVYDLSHVLYPSGFGCIGERCPSNDHTNGDRDYTPHSLCRVCGRPFTVLSGNVGGCAVHGLVSSKQNDEGRPSTMHFHRDGGYALKHSWL